MIHSQQDGFQGCCPLCHHPGRPFCKEASRGLRYGRCSHCRLIYMDPAQHLSLPAEKAQYLLHNNDVSDPRYQNFVRPLFEAIVAHIPKGSHGLDYGAGPGPVLAEMLRAEGYKVDLYDPIFHPEHDALQQTYDFVFASEVCEHFCRPDQEFQRLRGLLRAGGWLMAMTLLWRDQIDFVHWHYRNDPTHVVFYCAETVAYIEQHYQFQSSLCDGIRVFGWQG